MVKEKKRLPIRGGEEGQSPPTRAGGGRKAGTPAEFIYDNAQILLQLLRARSEEEDRRRFIAGLLRGPDDTLAPEDL